MSTEPNQSASPFKQPVPPAQQEADAATARENAKVSRPATAEPNRPSATWSGSAQERWAEQQARRTAEDPWLDSSKTLTRDKDGNLLIDGKRADALPDQQQQGQEQQQQAAGEKFKIGEFELTEAEARGLLERKALEDSRKLTLPADPNGYKLELPKDFVVPQGIEFAFNEQDPIAGLAREFAHETGLSQEQFSKLAGIYAAIKVRETSEMSRLAGIERQALGATGPQRIDAIHTFLRAHLGEEIAKPFMATTVTAKQVEGWEKLMMKIMSPTHETGFSHRGRDPGEPQRVDPKEYDSWSYTQKKEYAEQFSRRQNGRG
jgi:hypothetical protein